MTGRLNGVGEARSRRCAADDLFSRICSEPPGRAPAGSRARNRVSKSARFRPAAKGAASRQSIAEIAGRADSGACGAVVGQARAPRTRGAGRDRQCGEQAAPAVPRHQRYFAANSPLTTA
ncbi:hypothetical protein CUJ89_17180 [Burkholderia pyrrocinia]|uniref:Uncharacterized protein n=1 Tax=Burkholderia pyrrocinia TaxID=60550 RepID=A0A2Z5MXP1_BURPY|nr:hypothetical protein CUJ89_17180 [Burkholderia pyrrocinia]